MKVYTQQSTKGFQGGLAVDDASPCVPVPNVSLGYLLRRTHKRNHEVILIGPVSYSTSPAFPFMLHIDLLSCVIIKRSIGIFVAPHRRV
jgi:hypothetical protein